jgi:glutathione S-transferase
VNGDLALYQSNIILSYLDENFPETRSLTPDSSERRARMRIWLDWVDELFAPDMRRWLFERKKLSAEESHALEVRLEKHLYRLKTPLQKNRRYLVIDELTQADLAAHAMLSKLRATGFPTDYPERFTQVWEWMDRVEEDVRAGRTPAPKVLRRTATWPN